MVLCASSAVCWSQTLAVDWIEVAGNKVVVHYNLADANPNHQYLVSLLSSQDNFVAPLAKVSGDVGTEVKPGMDKKITWDITKELGAFKGNLTFELRGRVFIPFAKLVEFNEGKVFKRGKNTPLNWTSGNLSGQVNIELFKGQERIPVENNVPNLGKYDWHIPANTKKGSDYKLKFTNTKDRNDFVVSKPFTIKPKIPAVAKFIGIAAVGYGIYFAITSGSKSTPEKIDPPLPDYPGTTGLPTN